MCCSGRPWVKFRLRAPGERRITHLFVHTNITANGVDRITWIFLCRIRNYRDVAELYAQSAVGSLPDHKFLRYTKGIPEYKALPDVSANGRPLKFMIEVYIDDYINLVIARSKCDLDNISNTTMHGMHSVFPTNKDDSKDSILEKKMVKKDGQWRIEKDVLGWTFGGKNKTMILEEETLE